MIELVCTVRSKVLNEYIAKLFQHCEGTRMMGSQALTELTIWEVR